MAAYAVAAAVNASDGVVDAFARSTEFYRYLTPANLVAPELASSPSTDYPCNDPVPSLSSILAPLCQLITFRTRAPKALLNVMNRDTMYFLAEASWARQPDGEYDSYTFVEDPIMMACSSVPLTGRICELTLKVDPSGQQGVPMFIIPDLSKSDFANLGPIAGPPYYRFYAGTPITTPNGVNIGSLAIMDTQPREGLTESEIRFLGDAAVQTMAMLETNRQAIEGRRARRMTEGLEAFIAGKRSMLESNTRSTLEKPIDAKEGAAYGINVPASTRAARHHQHRSSVERTTSSVGSLRSTSTVSDETTDCEHQQDQDGDLDSRFRPRIFIRAANLLREAFDDLGEEGLVLFGSLRAPLDTGKKVPSTTQSRDRSSFSAAGSHAGAELNTDNDDGEMRTQRIEVLASSKTDNSLATTEQMQPQYLNLSEDVLRTLMSCYPDGNSWSLDDPSRGSSSEEESTFSKPVRSLNTSNRTARRHRDEIKALSAAFPRARKLLFVPIWDSSIGSFQRAIFVAASSDTRSLSAVTELSFLKSFCGTVMAECSRIDISKSDKQKGDFVGTVSHEMRSPLHGILASVEFLADTELSTFQKSLVDTIESCGRTLLDTINHVLDFSKVNSFQKRWEATNKRTNYMSKKKHYLGPDNVSKSQTQGAPPLLQLFAVTNIGAVLEEVIDGLVLGHTYTSGPDLMDMSKEARGRGRRDDQNQDLPQEELEIVLDVEQNDWTFLTSPGAVRRIILNITGNALKYTSHGTITVCLFLRPGSTEDTRTMILRVVDTGKGISKRFMETKLFVPFAQENALAPGTGLGMSIVKSIVTMLGGRIDVQSQVGKGTVVEVALPLTRPLQGQTSTNNAPHSGHTAGSSSSGADESLLLLQHQVTACRVSYYRSETTLSSCNLSAILDGYIQGWFGLEYVDDGSVAQSNIVITAEEDLDDLLDRLSGVPGRFPALIVLCSIASRHSSSYTSQLESRFSGAVGFVAKPIGPYKLARSVRFVLEKSGFLNPQFKDVRTLDIIAENYASPEAMPLNLAANATEGITEPLKEMNLGTAVNDGPRQVVQATETMAVSQVSANAQMAITSPGEAVEPPRTQAYDPGAFPFPAHDRPQDLGSAGQEAKETAEHAASSKATTKNTKPPAAVVNVPPLVNPRVLVVDDNKINLKLLQTFLKKSRKYTRIDIAEDGKQAVDVFTLNSSLGDGYEIVFMDITMPVMNGFEATRFIRAYEEQNSHEVGKGTMVIALTGLASGKDQAEGFDAGVDIYLTKPVSFKEVGKLLDNWEAHQKLKEGQEEIPLSLTTGKIFAENQSKHLEEAISPLADAGVLAR